MGRGLVLVGSCSVVMVVKEWWWWCSGSVIL